MCMIFWSPPPTHGRVKEEQTVRNISQQHFNCRMQCSKRLVHTFFSVSRVNSRESK